MDTSTTNFNYPQLFDMDDQDLFQGSNLTETSTHYNNKQAADDTMSYLSYLQSNNNNNNTNLMQPNNDFFYEMMMIPPPPPPTSNTMDLIDYDYFTTPAANNPTAAATSNNLLIDQQLKQQQQYNWLYDPIDTFLSPQPPTSMFNNFDSIMSEGLLEENMTAVVEGGMSRDYVSLSDVNSFVAEADSIKHSNSNFCLNNNFSSSESTLNDDDSEEEEEEYSDSETEFRWPMLNTSYSTPTIQTTNKQKLMIKIKKPTSSNNSSALPSPYGDWNEFISPKSSKSSNTSNSYRSRKSMSNIFNTTLSKKKSKLFDNTKRRGSAPHKLTLNHNHSSSSLTSLNSSSSLTSLSNNLTRSMRVSDNFASEDEEDTIEDEEDEEDDEYQIRTNSSSNILPHQLPTKKGRNVDKACNHCKRSHLRCDDMRPCRRCVATGKTGCKDVQHKPRGRPKLIK